MCKDKEYKRKFIGRFAQSCPPEIAISLTPPFHTQDQASLSKGILARAVSCTNGELEI